MAKHANLAARRRISPGKAREMLHNPPGGRALSKKQRGLFGAIASGMRKHARRMN
jgi:hypothetical protein